MKLLTSRVFAEEAQTTPEPTLVSEMMDQEVPAVEQEPSDEEMEGPPKTWKENLHTVYSASRSELLGRDPRTVRAELRSKVEPGHYLSEAGRKMGLLFYTGSARASRSRGLTT